MEEAELTYMKEMNWSSQLCLISQKEGMIGNLSTGFRKLQVS